MHGDGLPRSTRAPVVALALGATSWALLAAGPLYDGDGWWHLRTGEWILDHHSIPRADPFSWTARGAPWQPNSWLFDVLLALLHRAGGLVALSVFKSVAVMAIAFALFALCRRAGAAPWPAAFAAFAGLSSIYLFISERPQVVSYLLFAATIALATQALDGSNTSLAGLAGVIALWANLHGVFVTGVAFVGVLAAARALRERDWRRPALVVALAAAAGLCNAYGITAVTHAADVRRASQGIREWQHFDPLGWPDRPIAVFALATAIAIVRTGRWRRLDVILPLGLLAVLTADALRSAPLLVVLAASELALGLGTIPAPRLERPRLFAGVALAGWAATVTTLLPFAVANAGHPRGSTFPVDVVSSIPRGCRVLNEYGQGGFIGWKRPDVPVSQDSRNDVFGVERLRTQRRVLRAQPAADALAWLDRNHVDCVVAANGRPIVELLEGHGGWRVVGHDSAAVLVART